MRSNQRILRGVSSVDKSFTPVLAGTCRMIPTQGPGKDNYTAESR